MTPERQHTFAPLPILLAAALSTANIANAAEAIPTPDAYAALVTGKALVWPETQTTLKTAPDRTITGQIGGAPYTGAWSWRSGLVCFKGTLEGHGTAEICGRPSVSDDILSIQWDAQTVSEYQIKDLSE